MHNRLGVDASSTTGDLYRIDSKGKIFQYIGWKELDSKPNTIGISAGDFLYKLDSVGYIFKYLPDDSTWLLIDNSGLAKAIATGGPYIYKLHNDGSVWKSTGSSTPVQWSLIDNNSENTSITADGSNVYLLRRNGAMLMFNESKPWSWDLIDNNTKSKFIVAGWGYVYQMHHDGSIGRRSIDGTPWEVLDSCRNTVQITVGAAGLFQRHLNPQQVYRHVQGREWMKILQLGEDEGVICDISSGNDGLYMAKKNGEIWRYDPISLNWFNTTQC